MIPVGIVYQFDPLGRKVGGIQTFLRGFISHAPDDFDIRHLGVTTDIAARPVGKQIQISVANRSISFLPVLFDGSENARSLVPLSLKFTLAARKWRNWCGERVLLFNRIEPALAFRAPCFKKIGFVHNDIPQVLATGSEGTWRHAPRIYEWIERQLMRDFEMLYTVNGNTLNLYSERYPELTDRISFLATWVDDEVFAPPDAGRHQIRMTDPFPTDLPVDLPWLLFVGRFQHQKDPFLLVESFAAIRRRGSNAILLLVGEGNLRSEVEALAKQLRVRDSMYFLGALEQSDLARLYQRADLLLLTSRFEGMPRAPLEAVGCGLPVITTRAGEVARFVVPGVTGEIVDERTAATFADAVLKALSERDKYTVTECMNAVVPYRPTVILKPVYEKVRQIFGQAPPD